MHVHVHAYRGWSGLYNVNTNATDGMYGTVLPTSNTKPSFQRGSDSHPASVFEGAGPCAARRVFAELLDTAPQNSKYPYHKCRHPGNIAGNPSEYEAAPAARHVHHISYTVTPASLSMRFSLSFVRCLDCQDPVTLSRLWFCSRVERSWYCSPLLVIVACHSLGRFLACCRYHE